MRSRITIAIVSWQQNDHGGVDPVDVDSWEVWANVENRTGGPTTQNAQQLWQYDYKITKRYEASRPVKSNYEVRYKGMRMKINSVSPDREGNTRYEVLRCTVIDEDILPQSSS
ncbi:MAG TPA: phage head closure protein [Ferruginibacter sp.]|nr:phage head closure protein [Ferruginibacter sp.]